METRVTSGLRGFRIVPALLVLGSGHQQYSPDTSGGVGEVLHLFGLEGAFEDGVFAVGEPFLEDLVAAELVAPDVGGHVAPVGAVVEVDVEGGIAEDGRG